MTSGAGRGALARAAGAPAALTAAALAWACASPSLAPEGQPTFGPAFYWEARAPGAGTVFLLGSVHVGKPSDLRLSPRIERDWSQAEELVVEVDLGALTDREMAEVALRAGRFPPGRTLRDAIGEETRHELADYARRRGWSLEALESLRPWAIAQTIVAFEMSAAGFSERDGIDAYFLARARGRIPVAELESFEEQVDVLAAAPPATEEALLRDTLREIDSLGESTREMLQAWERGDEEHLLAALRAASEDPLLHAFHERVFVERNRRMAERIAALSADGRTRFVVVGTGHLIGPESVPELLHARGFSVDRVAGAWLGWARSGERRGVSSRAGARWKRPVDSIVKSSAGVADCARRACDANRASLTLEPVVARPIDRTGRRWGRARRSRRGLPDLPEGDLRDGNLPVGLAGRLRAWQAVGRRGRTRASAPG